MKIVFDDVNGNEVAISKNSNSGNLELSMKEMGESECWFTFRDPKQLQKFIKAINQIQEEEA